MHRVSTIGLTASCAACFNGLGCECRFFIQGRNLIRAGHILLCILVIFTGFFIIVIG